MKEFVLTATLALFTFVSAGMAPLTSRAADAQSPLGLWKTVDDKTGMPRAMVRIYLQSRDRALRAGAPAEDLRD